MNTFNIFLSFTEHVTSTAPELAPHKRIVSVNNRLVCLYVSYH